MMRNIKVGKKEYALITMYTAPIIDILNGAVNGDYSLGIILRGIIVVFNIFLITRNIPYKNAKLIYGVYYSIFYFIVQMFFLYMFFSDSIQHNLIFFMKIVLYLSEYTLLYNYLINGRLSYEDFRNFWKYSSVVVPFFILIVNLLGIGAKGRAGFFASTNALSIILVMQIIISMYYAREEKVNWLVIFGNLTSVMLLGTKSPLFFIAISVILIIIFCSKKRIRMLSIIVIIGIFSYYAVSHYFLEQWNSIIQYQFFHYNKALINKDIFNYLVSGRNVLVSRTFEGIKSLDLIFPMILFGLSPYYVAKITGTFTGYADFRGVEQDFIEILFCYGIFITVFIFSFFFKALFSKGHNRILGLYLNLAIICTMLYSILGGHGVTEAISGMYCAILLATKQSISFNNTKGESVS